MSDLPGVPTYLHTSLARMTHFFIVKKSYVGKVPS